MNKRDNPAFLAWLESDFPEFEDDFEFFLEMRKQVHKSKNSENSEILLKLRMFEWFNQGYDLSVILEHCTVNEYKGLWKPPGMEAKQKHLVPAGPLFDIAKTLAKKKEIPRAPNPQKQRAAVEAMRQILNENSGGR